MACRNHRHPAVELPGRKVTGRAAHAGLHPERGINATVALAHAIRAVADLADPLAGATVTPTVAASGRTANTVPDRAVLRMDVRVKPAVELEREGNALLGLSAVVEGARLDVSCHTTRSPLQRESSQALFELASLVAADRGHPAVSGATVGGVSDANLTAAAGIRNLDGLGPSGVASTRPTNTWRHPRCRHARTCCVGSSRSLQVRTTRSWQA